jgi:hypothetical protein
MNFLRNSKSYYLILIILHLLIYRSSFAQDIVKDSISKDTTYIKGDFIVFEGDTLLIELEEIHLLKKLKFKSHYDRRYYYWFRKKVHNAYPYAKLAQDRLIVINKRLKKIKSKRKRRRYTKRLQKYFEKEFTAQLKNLTRTEGRVLIKLIHRQTGATAYDMVKGLRSGWKAFWYEGTAKLFKLSLKNEYHPESIKEDYLIEDILQRAFINMKLEKQVSKLDFNFEELALERSDFIEIEK